MIICDVCKKDPLETLPKDSPLRANPWGIVFTPPPGSGLPERRACMPCTLALFDSWASGMMPPVETSAAKLN